MYPQTAAQTLAEARSARARGDVNACLRLSALTMDRAAEERAPDMAFLAACAPGRLFVTRGEPAEAIGWYRYALDVAMEGGLTRRLPEVFHDLFAASRDKGDTEQARRYFSTSVELYLDAHAGNPRLVALYADAAEGAFMRRPTTETAADALLQWRSFSAANASHADRFLGGCSIMAAAAWLGIRSRYDAGVALVGESFPFLPDLLGVSMALLHGAGGALRARDYPRAADMASEALRIAGERGEVVAESKARDVLSAALAEQEHVS